MHSMRKRRLPASSFQDALQTLRTAVNSAASAQKLLPESHESEILSPPALPSEFSKLLDTNSLDDFSDSALQQLQNETPALLNRAEQLCERWDDLNKQLRSALDAVLLVITLKSELSAGGPLKRRRQPTQSPPALELPQLSNASGISGGTGGGVSGGVSGGGVSGGGVSGGGVSGGGGEVGGDDQRSPSTEDNDLLTELGSASIDLASVAPTDIPELNAAGKLSALNVGQAVAFKVPKSAVDEWIQCEITKVLVPHTRFEVRDPEPDDDGNPGQTYQARLRDIMPLPRADQPLKPLALNSIVFARYPDTTAFYKARVTRYSPKKRVYYLRFEGEDDVQKEIEVSDLLVIPAKNRR